MQFSGERDGAPATGRGGALTYVLRWHALQREANSAYVDFG
jgi:hypothetical protein